MIRVRKSDVCPLWFGCCGEYEVEDDCPLRAVYLAVVLARNGGGK